MTTSKKKKLKIKTWVLYFAWFLCWFPFVANIPKTIKLITLIIQFIIALIIKNREDKKED